MTPDDFTEAAPEARPTAHAADAEAPREATERPRDWLDDILAPASPAPTGKPARPEDDEGDELEADPRFRLLRWLRGEKSAKGAAAEPECAHVRTVPVHAQPYGELVAMLCLDCDEQLEAPDPDEEADDEETPAATGIKAGARPGRRAPVSKRPQRRRQVSISHVRPILFTLSAGAFGYSIGLTDALGSFLPAVDHGAFGTIGTVLALGAAYGTWCVLRMPGVAGILPGGIAGRCAACMVVATAAPGFAPDVMALLNQYGAYVGLDASAVALLAASTALCGGLYWLVDRRFKGFWWPVRWLARIPLASAVLAVALYSPGPR
ncbi:hypothetical protein ACFUEN_29005 [Streptomyces griseorubiginosus]|uniref:hypothetical protein n=1 Tax=Streptomyces griseorubiginosus TaxID=67304 RepID=UPI00362A2B8B